MRPVHSGDGLYVFDLKLVRANDLSIGHHLGCREQTAMESSNNAIVKFICNENESKLYAFETRREFDPSVGRHDSA